ncbi:MAG: glycosyltransferase family 4 protein [Rhodobacteraceae bacterium]|nr:glycosyltransferase family 4 protein [Paracoccaceae bacterium]
MRRSRGTIHMYHVVFVNDHANVTGGQAKVAIAGAAGLARRGHHVSFYCRRGTGRSRSRCRRRRDDLPRSKGPGQRSQQIPDGAAGDLEPRCLGALTRLLATLPKERTIVHVHGFVKGLSPSVWRAIDRSGLPFVHTAHDYFITCPNGAYFDYTKGINCPLRPMSFSCITCHCDARSYAQKLFRVVRQLALSTLGRMPRRLKHINYMTNLQRAVLVRDLPDGIKFHQVLNPIDVVDRGPVKLENNSAFVFVGRLSHEKGVLLLAQAARELGAAVSFIGTGYLSDRIGEICPDARVTGWLAPNDVIESIRGARALVLPSTWYEVQGMVILEALGNGVPVIISDNCAGREAITNGETGLLFANGDVEDLKKCMRTLADDAIASRMGRAAYNRYWQRPLTLDTHLDQLEAVYAEILGEPLGRGAGEPAAGVAERALESA